jgi:hypothetical protein
MVWYATREDVMRALDSKLTARNSAQIDRAVESASRDVEGPCHRRFYPELATRRFDWPPRAGATPWILRLNDNELISVSSLTSGSTTIASSDYFLRRADDKDEPPYTRIELDLDSSASFGEGATYQRDIAITGLFGYRNDETTAGLLTAAVTTTTATTISVNAAASAAVGVGSLLRVDSERLLVTGRTMADTGQNVGGAGLTAQANNVTLAVSDGTAFALDEILLVESERMLVVDIAGNNLTVKRGWDGSVLAAHAAGVDIYAPRSLTVTRGALGTTAATHASGTTVQRWDPPGLVRRLTIAEAINTLTSETAGYSRAPRSGEGGSSERNRDLNALAALRENTYQAVGRKARVRSV